MLLEFWMLLEFCMLLGTYRPAFYELFCISVTICIASTGTIVRPGQGFNERSRGRLVHVLPRLTTLVAAQCDSKESFEGRCEQL